MLRRAVLIFGVALLVGAVLAVRARVYGAAIYLCIAGAMFTLGVLFEGWRYAPQRNANAGRWQRTDERFVDPASGKLVDVWFNPDTGERDYRQR